MALSPSVRDRELEKFDKKNNVKVALHNSDGGEIDVQNPIPADGDSIYVKDIDLEESDIYNFSGEISDFFDSLTSISEDITSNNPKQLMFWFKRTVYSSAIGLGCNDLTGNFSNIVVKLLGSGEVVRNTVDLSADSTKLNSKLVEFEPSAFNGIIVEFHTADPICLSNITLRKAIQTDSRIQGQDPTGKTVNFQATKAGNFKVALEEYGDTPSIDAFARLRVSEPFTLFDSKQLHDKQPLFWDEVIGGNATSTHVQVDACTEMTVTANAADYIIRQTRQRMNYQPGKSQLCLMTFYAPQADGLVKRVGMFDGTGVNFLTPNNGIFFESNGTPSWNIAKGGSITQSAAQLDWNYDKMDGSGPSGVTLNLDGPQILIIDYEWLGLGRVRVGFVIGGVITYCHYFNHANNPDFDSVYMSTPNLPLRYSIETDGTAGGTIKHVCSTVISEGGIEKTGNLRVVESPPGGVAGIADLQAVAVCGIRLKDLYKDITVIPESMSMVCTTNDVFRWAVALNPTVSGTFTYNDLANSAVQYAIGTNLNTVTSQGLIISSGYASAQSREADTALKTALRIGQTIAGVKDELVLMVTAIGANATIYGTLNFRELI